MILNRLFRLTLILMVFFSCTDEKQLRPISVVQHPYWSINKTIYELNIRHFSEEGTFKSVEQRLPELKALGVGIIWLMPIHPIGEEKRKGKLGSPYAVKDYLDVNPQFGTKQDFRELVQAIHNQGMYVILDWVANHSARDNVLVKEHPEFYIKDEAGNFVPPNPDWYDVIDLDYDNMEMRRYMMDALKYWVQEFDVDGYRCDVAELVPIDFWDRARAELDAIKPVFMLAEGQATYLHNRAFDMTYSWDIYRALNDITQGKKTVQEIDKILAEENATYPPTAWRMRFITNHDENSWNGTAVERLGDGLRPAAVLTATLPGKPLIYNGQEVGIDKSLEFFEKDPIDWQDKNNYRSFYSKLFNLYQANPALYSGTMVRVNGSEENHVYAFARVNEPYKVFVVLNLSADRRKAELRSEFMSGEYRELFSGVQLNKTNKELFDLEPWAYRVYVKVVESNL